MQKRNMHPKETVYKKINTYCNSCIINSDLLFKEWHNDRYYKQCYSNLEEKYDRGIISDMEWEKINSLRLK